VISSCEKKKYPEDERKSWHSSCWRLKGKWKIDKIVYNGNDITASYNDTLSPYAYNDLIFDFQFREDLGKGGKKDWVFITTADGKNIGNVGFGLNPKANYALAIYKRDDFQNIEDLHSYEKITRLLLNLWNIKKLYNKQLHIQSYYGNYELYFKQ
ncbi:MAG: hypothetical protein H0W84_09550, partial [Bacteroidetes bacterium]|nr:hypothetical protein [Bacteroidota bacterium]